MGGTMNARILHIFRNTPFGRETLMQSGLFAGRLGLDMVVYVPREKKFLMYFEHDVVQVDLDDSYLRMPESADRHVREILNPLEIEPQFVSPDSFTASTLPDVPTDFEFMCCPRAISDLSAKIGLGYIGSKVRQILKSASFPVLIPSPVFKPWTSVSVLFGGSEPSLRALRLGLRISRETGLPLDLFTQAEGRERGVFEAAVEGAGLSDLLERHLRRWKVFVSGSLEDNLYAVGHDSLVVLGAYGHGTIKTLMFGSTTETVQSVLPNSLLIVGPGGR